MARPIEPGDWRILHGAWSDGGADLTIIATRLSPPVRPRLHDAKRLARALQGVRALLRSSLRISPDKTSGIRRLSPAGGKPNMSKA